MVLILGTTSSGLSPDVKPRKVTEKISFSERLNDHPTQLGGFVRQEKILRGDTFNKLFTRLKISNSKLLQFLTNTPKGQNKIKLIAGESLMTTSDHNGELLSVFLIRRNGLTTEIKETTEGFIATEAQLETRYLFGSGAIESSLYAALDSAGISDELGSEMADILSSEIDFNRDLRSGDRFSVIYTAKYLRGTYVSYGQIQALEFINKARKYRAYVFIDPKSGQPSYYDVQGENIKNAFLKSPLKFSRVTSGFSKRRLHPVLKKWRAHKGIDYGARPGTPIMATGKGKITYRGTKGAYGRFIEIRHANGISTRYAHMSKYAKGLKKGSRVDQGQVIGFVGSSGMATGPHLHYEFLVRGKQINPSKAVPAPGPPINAQLRKNFDEQTARSAELLEKLYKPNAN